MNCPPLVPPLKCQGIKTKLVHTIREIAQTRQFTRWVEPFCGSCVVALNIQPKKALLCDANPHIIRLYQDIQCKCITPADVRGFLAEEGVKLKARGEPYYYIVRERFNAAPCSLDFLFLNRSCFNGVMRFNRRGKFNVPYCHKPQRFSQAYVTKITNQVRQISEIVRAADWTFAVRDFRDTLSTSEAGDFVYIDPPYAGRHVDYFNSWSDEDENSLAARVETIPCDFLLSTWHSNEFRTNAAIARSWSKPGFSLLTRKHYYHVGSSEHLRHPMIEALVANFPLTENETRLAPAPQQLSLAL
jgi:DNA adenine methylase